MKTLEEISLNKGEYGGGFSAVDYIPGTPRYVRITDITEEGELNAETKTPSGNKEEWKKYLLEEGDLLFARSGATVGKTFLYDKSFGDCVYAGYLIKFRLNQEIAFPKFVYYYTKTPQYFSWIKSKQNVVAQPNINAQQYGKELQIPLPPLPEQKRIVALLDAADSLRRKDKALLAKYDELSKSLFLEMFGDPVRNEKGWEKRKINDIGKVVTGSTPPSKLPNMFGTEIEFITPGDMESEKKTKRFLSPEGKNYSRIVPKGSLLVCCIGATIGKRDIAKRDVTFNQQINAVIWSEKIVPIFSFHAFNWIKNTVIERAISTTLPILKKSEFEKIEIIVPEINIQRKFANIIESIETQKRQVELSLAKSEEVFRGVMGEVFK